MKLTGFILITVLSFAQAQAKTILISDIDDTIKNSHVLDKSDSFFNADKFENAVLGMSELYKAAKDTDTDLKLFYVTNAPKSLMAESHKAFLSLNKFPRGALRLRDSIFQSDFKITEIRKILKDEKPEFVILIGDNGEKDVYFYEQIAREHPSIQFVTYIRQAYATFDREDTGAPLRPGQTGFITALDLALHFRKEGFVAPNIATDFMRDFISVYATENEMNDDGPQAIPSWVDCRNLQWTARDYDLSMEVGYQKTKDRVLERCSIPALED